jgi:hypothetical protein
MITVSIINNENSKEFESKLSALFEDSESRIKEIEEKDFTTLFFIDIKNEKEEKEIELLEKEIINQ